MSRERTPFGQRMLKAREDAGLTQMQVRKLLTMSQGTLSFLERTAHGTKRLMDFARIYGVDPEWLANGVGTPQKLTGVPSGIVAISDSSVLLEGLALTHEEVEFISAFRVISEEEQQELLHHVMARAEHYNKFFQREMQKRGIQVTGVVSASRAAETLPPAPSTTPPPTTYKLPTPSGTGNVQPAAKRSSKVKRVSK